MIHKIEFTDEELVTLQNALQIAFRAVWQQAEELNKMPDMEPWAKGVFSDADRIDDFRESLPKIQKVQ